MSLCTVRPLLMRESRGIAPAVSVPLLRLFGGYVAWYIRRSFHAVRVAGIANSTVDPDRALIVILNHPSWWDPLIALTLALKLFAERSHFAPIEAAALRKYSFFQRIGFFPVEPGTAAGAATFLRTGQAILRRKESALWITAQGSFTDPRARPVLLRSGTGHLVARCGSATVLPVAVEYPFWQERFPEALVRIGEPFVISDGASRPADAWTRLIAEHLERAQDRLAEDAMRQNREAFEILARGRTGKGIYDVYRSICAMFRGRKFDPSHGSERL